MKLMILLSLLLNVVVLVPVAFGMATGANWAEAAYGPASSARGILLAVYLAILVGSVGFLFRPVPEMVAVLLGLQFVYKIITPVSVGTLSNPVVVSNLGIAAFHAVTLSLIVYRASL